MADDEGTLVLCPSCGSIQDRSGQCGKCGKDIPPSRPAPGESPSEATIHRHDEKCEVPPGTGNNRATTRLTLVENTPRPEEPTAYGEPEGPSSEEHPPSRDTGPGRGALSPIYMPVGKLVTLSIVTFCIYQIFWFYRNWKILENYHDRWLRPGKLTFMMLIPFYGIYLVYKQLSGINEMVTQKTRGFPVVPILTGWIVVFGWICVAAEINAGFLLFSIWLGSVFLFIPVQRSLNDYAESTGPVETSSGSRITWMAAAIAVIILFLVAGIGDSTMRYARMKSFKAETASLDAAKAYTSDETRDLLVRYGSYIGLSKGMMNATGLLKDEKDFIYGETSKMIRKLPEKLHCVSKNEIGEIQEDMTRYVLKDNTYVGRFSAAMDMDMARMNTIMKMDIPGAPRKEEPTDCTSAPFDMKAFIQEMAQKKKLVQQSGQGDTAQTPFDERISLEEKAQKERERFEAESRAQEQRRLENEEKAKEVQEAFRRKNMEHTYNQCMKICEGYKGSSEFGVCADRCRSKYAY